jgi:putative aldouronate transport system substrate-binding protein
MREWFEAGYIYQDFASRTNDLFYLPNTALTYGGAAGAWFGLSSQAGDAMSMPEYNLIMDVQPVPSPVDSANGQTIAYPFGVDALVASSTGVAITSACQNIPKLLSVLDFMYSEHGGRMRFIGLGAEDGAADNDVYKAAGLQDGAYWYEDGVFTQNPITYDGTLSAPSELYGVRFHGLNNNADSRNFANEAAILCDAAWRMYQDEESLGRLPGSLFRPTDEDKTYADNTVKITDYLDTSVPKFIMGTTELNDDTWAEFVNQLKALGIEENIRIQQEAYDRYLAR